MPTPTKKKSMPIVKEYGTMWPRNDANIAKLPRGNKNGVGVYVLFDGSMPLYVGKGKIHNRVVGARKSKRRGQLWDRFSWYALTDPCLMHDVEMVLLKILPRYLRALTRQDGKFCSGIRMDAADDENCERISRKWPVSKS